MSAPSKNQGNVLFLILIAVALFAALSYAVTSSTRTNGSTISKDKARANAAALIQYTTSLRNAVVRMKLSNGCTDTTLDFSNIIYTLNNGIVITSANSNAPVNKKCHLFDVNGGNMLPTVPVADALDLANSGVGTPTAVKAGHAGITIMQIAGNGTDDVAGTVSANDINFNMSFINKETCLAVNDLVGVNNPNGDAPVGTITGGAGAYTNGSLASTAIISDTDISGHEIFCRHPSGQYKYFHVLVER